MQDEPTTPPIQPEEILTQPVPRRKIPLLGLFAFLVLVLLLPATILTVQHRTNLKSTAAALPGQAEFSFSIPSTNLTNNQLVTLNLDTNNRGVGFVRADVVFDTSKINLTGEVTTSSLLPNVISKTTMANANNSGIITIVLGLCDPFQQDCSNLTPPPSGVFEFAKIPLAPKNQTVNGTTSLTVDTSKGEVVDVNSASLQILVVPLSLGLNVIPTNTPTPRLSPTPTLRPTATPTPRPTATPTPRPTTIPTPTRILSPTPTPIPPTSTPRPTAIPTSYYFPSPTARPFPTPTPGIPKVISQYDLNKDGCVNRLDLRLVFSIRGLSFSARMNLLFSIFRHLQPNCSRVEP